MEVVARPDHARVVIDYAHTPDALKQALQACEAQCEGELWVVFGCGGDRDASKRESMGAIACESADHVVVTSDNPRREDPVQIIRNIQSGCDGRELAIVDRQEAITYAVSKAQPEDIVLVAGKGHETYQIIGDDYLPMDDKHLARQAMEVGC